MNVQPTDIDRFIKCTVVSKFHLFATILRNYSALIETGDSLAATGWRKSRVIVFRCRDFLRYFQDGGKMTLSEQNRNLDEIELLEQHFYHWEATYGRSTLDNDLPPEMRDNGDG